MRYDFIEHHKQEFPVVVMCRVPEVSESDFYAWTSVLEARVNEKMLRLRTRFDRPFITIRADMGAYASSGSCVMMESAAHANGLPG